MKRLMMAGLVVALAPFLMGAGGSNPGIPTGQMIAKRPAYAATLFLDAHKSEDSATAGAGSVTISDHGVTSTVSFPPGTPGFVFLSQFQNGCSTSQSLNEARFVNLRLSALMGPYLTWQLLGQLGVQVQTLDDSTATGQPLFDPLITAVRNPRCTGSAGAGAAGPGVQIVDVTIQFIVPAP